MNELFSTCYGSDDLVPGLRAPRSRNRNSIAGTAEVLSRLCVTLKQQMVCDLRPYHGNSNRQ